MARKRRITKEEVTKILYRIVSHFQYDDRDVPTCVWHTVYLYGEIGTDVHGRPLVVVLDNTGAPMDCDAVSITKSMSKEFVDSLDKIDEVIKWWTNCFINDLNVDIGQLKTQLKNKRIRLNNHLSILNSTNIKFKGYGYESQS